MKLFLYIVAIGGAALGIYFLFFYKKTEAKPFTVRYKQIGGTPQEKHFSTKEKARQFVASMGRGVIGLEYAEIITP